MHTVFAAHFSRYPNIEPQDAVKLAYQSAYGAGHLVSDPSAALERLRQEANTASLLPSLPLLEAIGNDRHRLHLNSPEFSGCTPESVGFLFAEGAVSPADPAVALQPLLSLLREMAANGETPFSARALEEYLASYEAAGYPMVRHSETYRTTYSPAYRVMEGRLLRFLPLLSAIDRLLTENPSVVVAIDGMSAAGKTTLGDLLSRRYDCNLIHMDDFFLPPALRTPERFETPGGNVHYERFLEQVLTGLASGRSFTYNRFDCHVMACTEKISVSPKTLTVIEGAYSLHPALRDAYDLKVFYPVEPTEQLERIRRRNGERCMVSYRERWIPLENAYIDACQVKECCDLIL